MRLSLVLLILLWIPNVIAMPSNGQEFRIETEILRVDPDKFDSQNLTLFSHGYVHDFMTTNDQVKAGDEPQKIVIWNRVGQELVLLDVQREVKTVLSHDDIIRFNAALLAREELRKKAAFFFEPNFDVSYDSTIDWLTLKNEWMTYRARGEKPANETSLNVYQEFANWYVKLNAADPGKMPPFPRLALNKQIEEQGFIPTTVELDFKPSKFQQTIKLKSRHYLVWQLSQTDRELIEAANEMMVKFREVHVEQFQQVRVAEAVGN